MEKTFCSNNFMINKCGVDFTYIVALGLIGVLLFSPRLIQAASLSSDLWSQISRDDGAFYIEDTNSMSEVSSPLVDSVGVSAAGATASTSIDMDYGLIRTQASGYLNYGGTGTDYVQALANAQSSDLVTITGGASGTIGTLTAQVFISGSGNASAPTIQPPGYDEVVAAYQIGLSNAYGYGGTSISGGWNSTSDIFVGDQPGQAYTLTTQFVYGTSWELVLYSYLQVYISPIFNNAGIYQGNVNLSNTITWLGIDSITDESGNTIDNYSIISESGFNWSSAHPSAVPIPPALWLFVSGLLGMTGIAGRRKAANHSRES